MPASSEPFVKRYIAGDLKAFFEVEPGDLALVRERKLDRPREAIADALAAEAARLGAPAAALRSIDKLRDPESLAVVTGQQPGLLLGPSYTLSKALSAVALARRLSSEERPVIPIFWVASQDHDVGEIDHAYLLDFHETLHRLELDLPIDTPSGRIPFESAWLTELVEGLERVGGVEAHRLAACELLAAAAGVAETFADFFSALLYRLLGSHGMIVLDPSRPRIAPLFTPLLERELERPLASTEAIREAGRELSRLGLEPQLGRGREATNLFLEEPEGGLPRRRLLRFDGRSFHTSSRSYRTEELRELLRREPGRLTPAAGLRPISQDAVLPTAAFVVGPGELRYVAQLAGVYRLHGVGMPLVWPRASSVVLEPPVRRILERYGLAYDVYAAQRGRAMEAVLLERHGHAERFGRALAVLRSEAAELTRHVRLIDPTLVGTVERNEGRIEQSLEQLRSKTAAALARRDGETRRQFARLEAHLFPAGTPQERLLSPFSFFLKFGVEPMMRLYGSMEAEGQELLTP